MGGVSRSTGVHPMETRLWYECELVMTALFTLLPEAVATIRADGKQAILRELASRFASVYQLDAATVLVGLEDRE